MDDGNAHQNLNSKPQICCDANDPRAGGEEKSIDVPEPGAGASSSSTAPEPKDPTSNTGKSAPDTPKNDKKKEGRLVPFSVPQDQKAEAQRTRQSHNNGRVRIPQWCPLRAEQAVEEESE